MPMSWLEAIERVLREENRPMYYVDISNKILSKGYYKTNGATPEKTVLAQLSTSINYYGEKSPFFRVEKGFYMLRPAKAKTDK